MSEAPQTGSPADTTPRSPSPEGTPQTQTAPAPAPIKGDAGGTIMDNPADRGAPVPGATDWSALRAVAADGDDKFAKELERYPDIKSFAKSWKEQKAAISKGVPKQSLDANATPEQVADWRKANGIPESPDKYEVKLPDGMAIGEQDKPLVDKFLNRMHAKNTPPELVNEALSTYYEMQEEQASQVAEAVKAARVESEEGLRASWGPEFRSNVNAAKTLVVTTFGEDMANAIMAATDERGIPLGNNAGFLKGVLALAKEANPAAGALPPGTDGSMASLATEKAKYEKQMRDDRAGWFKDTGAQQRYQQILAALEKHKG